jgi:hypothetical protein
VIQREDAVDYRFKEDIVSRGTQSLCQTVRLNISYFEGFQARSYAVFHNSGRPPFLSLLLGLTFLLLIESSAAQAATYKTDNFLVHSSSPVFAQKVGDAAERYRDELSVLWLGQKLPKWGSPCEVFIKTGTGIAAGGETNFTFSSGEVYDWKMNIQGSEERILDSVLPHEITHTILASYLRAPAPRWLDEGMATSVESYAERMNYRTMLVEFLHTNRGIAFNDMVSMKNYPEDLTPFYSQSFSVCEYLILMGGHQRLIEFAREGYETNDWNAVLKKYYQCESLGVLQMEWVEWLRQWELANMPAELPPTRKLLDFNPLESEEIILARNKRLSVQGAETPEVELLASSAPRPRGGFNPANRFWDNLQGWERENNRESQQSVVERGQNQEGNKEIKRPLRAFPSFGRPNVSDFATAATRVVPETTLEKDGVSKQQDISRSASTRMSSDKMNNLGSHNILANGAGSATKEESKKADNSVIPNASQSSHKTENHNRRDMKFWR